MRILVISDTHIPDRYEDLPQAVKKELKKADLVLHAGDFTSVELFKEIKKQKPLKAVLGNMDTAELMKDLNEKETISIEKYKIGIMHGKGRAEGVLDLVKKTFDNTYDLVIFGHTHQAMIEKEGKTTYLNPGSPTDKIFSTQNSYAIVEINGSMKVEIYKI
ncbi:MAG TPA: metallophosphoesterase family protein [Candidatus Omnitrophota bacterium]|nr:metallophosphoesterase family protein [Candidatus Omnitrophota bacterium]